jgi:leucyl-tRNA synthetase
MTMALHDLDLVPFDEPIPRIRLGGLLVKEGAKMSKSRGNVVSPDPYVAAHGSDVLRCALLFTCPWETGGDFHDQSIAGIERFFARVWRLVTGPTSPVDDGDVAVEGAIVAVTSAIERLRFNVAIARLMELADAAMSARAKRVLVQLLAPLAPHLAEELWARLGESFSVHDSTWPAADAAVLEREGWTIVVQQNGRVRTRIQVDRNASESEVVDAAADATGLEPSRVVYVPGRLVNFVE